ncbi:hypothetical protein ACFSTH_10575 [Paenibacillus yanchengensis]|uniref:Copper amine oxidase-like N-terminal domain-containing protein n=1 Tax=Paenibacillus yanchengensis TaxID=2035833 RepID=A0ABW4YIX2_9BACL
MKKRTFVIILSTAMLASMATGAFAATKLQQIKAYLNPEIKVQVDGTFKTMRDGKGNELASINYNGLNYFPIAAIAGALDTAVDYNKETKVISLGEKVDGVSIAKGFSDMYFTKDSKLTTYKGHDYKEGWFNNGPGNREASFMLKPSKKYQTLYLKVATIDGDISNFTVKDADKDVILKQVATITPEEGLATIEVDIGGADSLYIFGDVKDKTAVFVPLTASYYK